MQPNRRLRSVALARQLAHRAAWAALVSLAVLGCATGLPATAAPAPARTSAVAPVPEQPRMMMLGDSITYGIGSTTGTGFRDDLAVRLSDAGVIVHFVGSQGSLVGPRLDHEGHPGWRIDEVAMYIDRWMASSRPDVVLLDIGTNDYTQSWNTATAPNRLSSLVDHILATSPTVRVVVAKLLVPPGTGPRARGIAAFNARIAPMAAAKGPRVSVTDMSRISNRNTTDGVHPNDAGYRQMSYQWFQALRRVLTGGTSWPASENPFPLPSVRLTRSASVVAKGKTATLSVQLTGPLTATDLARVPVQLMYNRLGSRGWTVLQTVRTSGTGRAVFRRPMTRSGAFVAQVAGGLATGRRSATVRVNVR